MRILALLFCLFLFPACQQDSLSILTWNIRAGKGMDGGNHLAELAAAMRRESPDIICLQEVDSATTRSNGVDQAGWLASQLNMQAYFAHNLDYQGGAYGTAILTRLPVLSHSHFTLPGVKEREPRGLQQITFLYQRDTLSVFNTHLDYLQNDSLRFTEAMVVDSIVRKTRHLSFLAGDLNDTPQSRTLTLLMKQLSFSMPEQYTFPANIPNRKIDYVLWPPELQVETAFVLPDTCSDHRAIFTRFKTRK